MPPSTYPKYEKSKKMLRERFFRHQGKVLNWRGNFLPNYGWIFLEQKTQYKSNKNLMSTIMEFPKI